MTESNLTGFLCHPVVTAEGSWEGGRRGGEWGGEREGRGLERWERKGGGKGNVFRDGRERGKGRKRNILRMGRVKQREKNR